jgi:hypothetical protein
MKLILENWNKFLQEQEINEATEQEIEYLNDALEIPVSELPFNNIFGNSYRIIEPVSGLKEQTPLANAIFALNKFGWQVDPASNLEYHDETKGKLAGKVKAGKILCSKTKVSRYIDGKGNQGISRKTITLNLPKVLGGIISFVKNSRDKLSKEAGAEMFTAAKRYADAAKEGKLDELPADLKYSLPNGLTDTVIKHTANEFRKIMKFYDAQDYWLGRKNSGKLKFLFNAVGVDFESFENFAKYAIESFDDLIRNMDQYLERNYIIYSRHPIDVFRMSDHQSIKSCHSLPSSKGEQGFDEYNKCALSEAYGNGMIAYIVPAKNFKMFPPTQESLDKVADEEIFYDDKRPDVGELVPTSRIRIKNVAFHKDENSQPIRLAVPQGKVYGPKVPGFLDAVNNRISKVQEKQVKEIIKQGSQDLGKPTIFLSNFTRYGGSYQDTGYSVAETLPMLFRKYNRDVVLQGSSVRYEPDVEEALLASIGQNSAEMIRQRLNEIFDEHTGGFISFDWDVEEGYDDIPGFTWNMYVKFRIDAPSDANGSEIRSIVEDTVDYDFPGWYDFPISDNIFIEINDRGTWMVKIVYDGYDLDSSANYLDRLEESLPEIMKKFDPFDYYYDNGPIQLIEFNLEEAGIIKSEKFIIRDVLRDYDLPDDPESRNTNSWWPIEEIEKEQHDYFGGEYISSIAFQDESSIDISEIIESVPQNLKPQVLERIAEFINMIVSSDELTGKLALNQSTWKADKDPNVIITITSPNRKLSAENLENVEDINFVAGVSMHSDYSKEILEKTGDFLKNNASIDELVERIQTQLKTYLENKLKAQQTIKESKRRVRIRVRR